HELQSVHHRHVDVGEDEIDLVGPGEFLERVDAIHCLDDPGVLESLQRERDQLAHGWRVFDNQKVRVLECQGYPPLTMWSSAGRGSSESCSASAPTASRVWTRRSPSQRARREARRARNRPPRTSLSAGGVYKSQPAR